MRNIKATLAEQSGGNTHIVCVGDKNRLIIQRTHKDNIVLTCNNVGKRPPIFVEAAFIAEQVMSLGVEFDSAEIVFNRFK